jgi:hypothetical protein
MSATDTAPRPLDVPAEPPPATSPPHDRPPRIALGLLLVLLGLGWLAHAAGLLQLRWQTALALAVLTTGVVLLATARRAGHGGLITLGIVLSLLLLATHVPRIVVGGEVGDRDLRPTTIAELGTDYELGAGQLTLDLRDLTLPAGRTPVAVDVGMGEIVLRLPEGATAEIGADVGMGEVDLLGQSRSGVGVSVDQRIPGSEGAGTLVLDLSVGMGTIEVTR